MSRRKFNRFLKENKNLPFVAMYNTRKLIIRAEFEAFLKCHPEVKEALKNGSPHISQKARRKA